VAGYKLGYRASIPDRNRGFFHYPLRPAGSGAHLTSCTTGTRVPIPRGKVRPGRDVDHSPPSSAEVKKVWGYTSSPPPPKRLPRGVAGQLYFICNLRDYTTQHPSPLKTDWIMQLSITCLDNRDALLTSVNLCFYLAQFKCAFLLALYRALRK
jgi:hypothetical protein